MKHESNRAFFAHWEQARGRSRAPERNTFAPDPIGDLLPDAFVAAADTVSGFAFRTAGARLCATIGRDLKGEALTALFAPEARAEASDLIDVTADELLPTVVGVNGPDASGTIARFELLLLPFANAHHAPASLAGLLAPFGPHSAPLSQLSLTSWRHLHSPRLAAHGPADRDAARPDRLRRHSLERFRAKWIPVRVKKTRLNKNLEPCSRAGC